MNDEENTTENHDDSACDFIKNPGLALAMDLGMTYALRMIHWKEETIDMMLANLKEILMMNGVDGEEIDEIIDAMKRGKMMSTEQSNILPV